MDGFKSHYGSVHAYLEQYVKTATKGKVKVEYALHVCRVRLVCTECQMTLTASEPTGTELDYGIQEFVKLHAHTGGRCLHRWVRSNGGYECEKCKKVSPPVEPKAVTADFKPVNHSIVGGLHPVTGGFGFVPLSTNANAVLSANATSTNQAESDMIDLKPGMASLIADKMAEYSKQSAAMTDEALAKKILKLQNKDYNVELQKATEDLKTQNVTLEEINASKVELQALQNILALKNIQKKKQQLLGELATVEPAPPAPPVKREKPLKIATGRKFR